MTAGRSLRAVSAPSVARACARGVEINGSERHVQLTSPEPRLFPPRRLAATRQCAQGTLLVAPWLCSRARVPPPTHSCGCGCVCARAWPDASCGVLGGGGGGLNKGTFEGTIETQAAFVNEMGKIVDAVVVRCLPGESPPCPPCPPCPPWCDALRAAAAPFMAHCLHPCSPSSLRLIQPDLRFS